MYIILHSEHRIAIDKLRQRELKWLEMFDDWEKWMSKRFKKVKIIHVQFFMTVPLFKIIIVCTY